MMSFLGALLAELHLLRATPCLLKSMAESKGRHAPHAEHSPQILKALRKLALVESTETALSDCRSERDS